MRSGISESAGSSWKVEFSWLELRKSSRITSSVPATVVTLIDDPNGSGLLTAYGEGDQDPATSGNTWSDADYFSFTALAGDVVSVAVATPSSDVNPYVELRNSADGVLTSDADSGADGDAYISHFTISSSGSYFARVGKWSSSTVTGPYQLRIDVVRNGVNLESMLSRQ